MKFGKYILPVIVLLMIGTLKATAVSKLAPKAYMFGFVANFTDSVIYFTDIQTVDSVWYDKKTKFLLGRSAYSGQLREFFANHMQKPHSTCIAFFALSRKDAEKKFVKLKKQYMGKNSGAYEIRNINENEFHFKPVDISSDKEASVEKPKKAKKNKKEKGKIPPPPRK